MLHAASSYPLTLTSLACFSTNICSLQQMSITSLLSLTHRSHGKRGMVHHEITTHSKSRDGKCCSALQSDIAIQTGTVQSMICFLYLFIALSNPCMHHSSASDPAGSTVDPCCEVRPQEDLNYFKTTVCLLPGIPCIDNSLQKTTH